MELSDEERRKIKDRLQRSNRRIWSEDVLPHVYGILNDLRMGQIKRSDWFIPNMVTYEDYILQLNLIRFV
jgi:hypothetical protein